MAESDITGTSRRTLQAVSAAGFIPLVAMTLWLTSIGNDHPWRSDTVFGLKTYAAIVLSFLAGTYWAFAIVEERPRARGAFVFGAMPALAGWASLMMPDAYSFAMLAVAFAAFGALDQFAARHNTLPHWTGRTRFYLTLLAVLSMIVAFAATAGSISLPANQGMAGDGINAILSKHVGD